MMRSCLVSSRVADFDDAGADRVRALHLLVFREAERVTTLAFDLGLVMGSSEVARRHPPHHLSPAKENTRQGKTPKRASAAPSHHGNAPIKHQSQSILSKIVALLFEHGALGRDPSHITNARRRKLKCYCWFGTILSIS
jgi:hypothetical protein